MTRKNVLLSIAATLGLAGTIAARFPGAGPAVGVALSGGGKVLQHVGDSLLDDCDRAVCGCDAKGECGVHGTVGFTDGGISCVCK